MTAPPPIYAVRSALPDDRDVRRTTAGLALACGLLLCWGSLFATGLAAETLAARLAIGVLLGAATGLAFVAGHDAAHGTLVRAAWLNGLLARLLMLPSLHLVSSWQRSHNRCHHGWTNLRGRDDGYPPLSPSNWLSLPGWRRWVYRGFYTLPGMGIYYIATIWWSTVVWLPREHRQELRSRRVYAADALLVAGFAAAQMAAVVAWGGDPGQDAASVAFDLLTLVLLPWLVWNWVMAFVTIQHHTHPQVKWFDDEREWSFFAAQVGGTVHMRFPWLIEKAFQNIFDHTAHHVDKGVPLFALPECQRALEKAFPDAVIVQDASLAHLRRVLRECQLYDYRQQRWMRFADAVKVPTEPSLNLHTS